MSKSLTSENLMPFIILPMTWIDEQLAELKKAENRAQRIYDQAPLIFDGLRAEILKQAEEAKNKGFSGLFMHEDELILPPKQSPNKEKRLSIKLTKDRKEIAARGSDVNVTFTLDLDEKNEICLNISGDVKKVYLPHAAMLILDPFLFPELPRRKTEMQTFAKNLKRLKNT